MELFEKELRTLINAHSKEGDSDTADYILANYLNSCLIAYSVAVNRRDIFEGKRTQPSSVVPGSVSHGGHFPIDHPEDHPGHAHTEDQLTMCMPAELRARAHPPFLEDMVEDMPPGRIETLRRPEYALVLSWPSSVGTCV